MEFLRERQLDLMLFLSGNSAALSVMVFFSKSIPLPLRKALACMEVGSALLLFSDCFAYAFRGDPSITGGVIVRISNFMVFFLSLFFVHAFNLYLKGTFREQDKEHKLPRLLAVADVILIIGVILLIISQFTGLYYDFDDNNYYRRQDGIIICYAIPMVTYIIQLITIFSKRKVINTRMMVSMVLVTLMPGLATVVQIFVYGLSLTNIFIVIMAMILYIFSLVDMNEKVENAKQQEIKLLKEEQETMQLLFEQTAAALATAIDAKDKYTHGHSTRVAEYSQKIAAYAGKDPAQVKEIYYSALLHDVGKIGVPDQIINKEGKLTDEEFAAIKAHPSIGRQILSSINISPELSIGASYHHERYDGRGYPYGLKGDDIPDTARIIAVADAYDAMTSKRSYRDPLPQQLVREEFVKGMDTQFDSRYAKIMLHLIDLDTEYELKEHEEVRELSGRSDLVFGEFRTKFTEGILLNENETKIHLRCTSLSPNVIGDPVLSDNDMIPAIIVFDSLDSKVHYNDKNSKTVNYFEYAEIRLDGRFICEGARDMRLNHIEKGSNVPAENSENYRRGVETDITAVRFKDHAKIVIASGDDRKEIIIALPDNARYAYLSFTCGYSRIDRFEATKSDLVADENTIERIAPEVSYIDGPSGNVPNIQIDGWRTVSTRGEELKDKMQIFFHAKSLPTARLIWHCPFIVLYSSKDGLVNGEDYTELALIRFDGECWDDEHRIENNMQVNKTDDFIGWEKWKETNKQGTDCNADITRKGNSILTHIDFCGLQLKNITTADRAEYPKVYVTLTGDQVALTNIWIKSVE